jgi:drug/metabolite transporter (DMT)-like permease
MLVILLPLSFFVGEDVLFLDLGTYLILAGIALVNNLIGDFFSFIAIRNIGVSLATPLTNAYPLILTLTSWLWFGEALTPFILGGTFFISVGLVLLNLRNLSARDPVNPKNMPNLYLQGLAAALLTALCWALGLSGNKYLTLQGINPTAITFWRGVFFGVMSPSIPLLMRLARSSRRAKSSETRLRVSCGGVLAAVGSSFFALFAGTWCYNFSLLLLPMNVATPIAASNPLIAAIAACAFMGERLRRTQWLGIVFVVTGAVLVAS